MDNKDLLVKNQNQEKFTNVIKQKDGEDYKLPFTAAESMFEFKESRTQEQVRQEQNESARELKRVKNDSKISYKDRRTVQMKDFKNLCSRLVFDKKWYSSKDSDEMERVKRLTNYLNNLLDKGITAYIKREGEKGVYLDAERYKEDVHEAFQEAIKACDNYIEKKRATGKGKHTAGIRRLRKVSELKTLFEVERTNFAFTIEALQGQSMEGFKLEDAKEDNDFSLRTLTTMHKTSIALETKWQNQGNSTDVYRIQVEEKGKKVAYYIKENLPLISADIESFLDRRLTQLKSSKTAMMENRGDDVEQRMADANMKEEDYDACIELLTTMQNSIKNASPGEKEAVKKRMINFLAHDFDAMFINLNINNQAADIVKKEGGEGGLDIKKWEAIAKDTDNPKCEVANYIIEYIKNNVQEGGDDNNGAVKKATLKTYTAKDWVIEKLGLKDGKNSELINQITKVYGDKKEQKLENLFRISLGKEVELFGQMRDRINGQDDEIAATNNTATGRLAAIAGFTDVVTTSDSRIVKFKDRNGQMVERFCTVIEEAQGQEFIEVIKDAEKEGLKIEYTPAALRKLMRLNAFDTICLQVDRHGRNFKCDTEKKDGKIIIKDLKSYDHDQSFFEKNLKDVFNGEDKKGFLSNPSLRIKKDSSMYAYVMDRYFGVKGTSFLNNIKEPDWKQLKNNAVRNSRFHSAVDKVMKDINKVLTEPMTNKYFAMNFNVYGGRIGDQDAAFYGDIYLKNGHKANEDETDLAQEELGAVFSDLQKLLVIKEAGKENKRIKKTIKSTFTKEEKGTLLNILSRLYDIDNKYDFSKVTHRHTTVTGYVDIWIKKVLYTYSEILKNDRDLMDPELQLNTDSRFKEAERKKRKEAFETLKDKKSGDLVIPSMLHFDEEAYNDLCELEKSMRNGDGKIEGELKGLNFKDPKIQALKVRCSEYKAMIKDAQIRANAFYKLAGWDKAGDVRGTFFLKKDDYRQLKDLSELAVDPGVTYLSIDNENFIYGVGEFLKHATNEEKKKAYEIEKKKRRDPKRWKQMDYGKDQQNGEIGEQEQINRITNNAVSSTISVA